MAGGMPKKSLKPESSERGWGCVVCGERKGWVHGQSITLVGVAPNAVDDTEHLEE